MILNFKAGPGARCHTSDFFALRLNKGSHMTSLDRVPVGWSARVTRVVGDDDATLRLLEMGLTPGLTLRVVGSAPLGDPIELELRGYRLSVRRREAARIEVEVVETAQVALAGA